MLFSLYRFALAPLALLVLRAFSFVWPEKIRSIIALKAKDSFVAKNPRDFARPLIWFHAASGEFEYAKPVMRLLKERRPDVQILVTYFSSSVLKSVASTAEVDIYGPLPWDLPRPLREFLLRWKPDVCLVARTDVWPEMAYQNKLAGLPTLLFSSTLADGSSRMGLFARHLNAFALNQLTQIICVSEDDQLNLEKLGVHRPMTVGGDTRFDQVLYRLSHGKALKEELRPRFDCKVLIAGSTWDEDEAVLLRMLSLVKSKNIAMKLILVPHEPTTQHVASLQRQLQSLNLSFALYSQALSWPASIDILIVDQVGILADLYKWANLAFVGGSFRKTVHSVMEALASGLVTFVGPYHLNNREALYYKNKKLRHMHTTSFVQEVSSAEDWLEKIRPLLSMSLVPLREEILNSIKLQSGKSEEVAAWALQQLEKR